MTTRKTPRQPTAKQWHQLRVWMVANKGVCGGKRPVEILDLVKKPKSEGGFGARGLGTEHIEEMARISGVLLNNQEIVI